MSSRSFGSERGRKNHLTRSGGVGREVLDLRNDVEAGFEALERTVATITFEPMELWVNAATGHDDFDGSAESPLATIIEAEIRIPDTVAHNVLVHVAPHTGLGYAPPLFRERAMQNGAQIDVIADSGGTEDDGLETLLEGIAQTGTVHTGLVALAGLGTDTYRGKTIEMTSGTQAGYRRTIKSNTDTVITPCLLWQSDASVATSIAPGDTFRVAAPVTRIYVPTGTEYAPHPNGTTAYWNLSEGSPPQHLYGTEGVTKLKPAINFVNFYIFTDATTTLRVQLGQAVRMFGCETNKAFATQTGVFIVGADGVRADFFSETAHVGTRCAGVSPEAWAGWGLVCGTGFLPSRMLKCHVFGIVATRIIATQCVSVTISGCNIHTLGVQVFGDATHPCYVRLYGKHYLPDISQVITNTTGHAVEVSGQGAVCSLDETALTAAAGSGVLATQGGKVHIEAGTTITALTGLKARYGGVIHFKNGAVTITASGTAIEVGNAPLTTGTVAGNFTTAGAYLSQADGSVVQRVT